MTSCLTPATVARTGEAYAGAPPVHCQRTPPLTASNAVRAPCSWPPTKPPAGRPRRWRHRDAEVWLLGRRLLAPDHLSACGVQARQDAVMPKVRGGRWREPETTWDLGRGTRPGSPCTARRGRRSRMGLPVAASNAVRVLLLAVPRVHVHAAIDDDRRRVPAADRNFPFLRERRRPRRGAFASATPSRAGPRHCGHVRWTARMRLRMQPQRHRKINERTESGTSLYMGRKTTEVTPLLGASSLPRRATPAPAGGSGSRARASRRELRGGDTRDAVELQGVQFRQDHRTVGPEQRIGAAEGRGSAPSMSALMKLTGRGRAHRSSATTGTVRVVWPPGISPRP